MYLSNSVRKALLLAVVVAGLFALMSRYATREDQARTAEFVANATKPVDGVALRSTASPEVDDVIAVLEAHYPPKGDPRAGARLARRADGSISPDCASPSMIPLPPRTEAGWCEAMRVHPVFPETFDRPTTICSWQSKASVRPLEGNASRAVLADEETVVYREAFDGCDLVYRYEPNRTEEFIIVRDEMAAPKRWQWKLDLPAGGSILTARMTPMHTIELVDGEGVPRLRIDAPEGKDANGRVLRAGEELACVLSGSMLTLSANLTDCAFPVVIDPSWSSTGSLSVARQGHTSTTLSNGKVLVTGGTGNSSPALASCELYDPKSKTWSAAGGLNVGRSTHRAVLLSDGNVLVTGGTVNQGSTSLASCEIYSPDGNSWTGADGLGGPRYAHSITLMSDGRVLVAGGYNQGSYLRTAEIYDVGRNDWAGVGDLGTGRINHTATLLTDGQVLVAGGHTAGVVQLDSCELFDDGTNQWSAAGDMAAARDGHSATLLDDGDVLVTGGNGTGGPPIATCELYEPSRNQWRTVGDLAAARTIHSATKLKCGKVLVAGGNSTSGPLRTCQLYDPDAETWSSTGSLGTARYDHGASLLNDGDVLVSGGLGASRLQSCERFPTPDIFSVSPNIGLPAGNTHVTLNGSNFASGATVTFGGAIAVNVTVVSATKITCGTPAHAEGAVDIVVTNPDGLSTTLVNGFTYTANNPPEIDSGPTTSDANTDINVTITFNATASDPDGDPVTLTWDFGDGGTATGEEVTHAYDTPGTYTVTLTVEDDKGASVSDTLTQIIKDPDGVTITRAPTAEPPTAVVGATVSFFVKAESPASPITYTWDFGDGSAPENTQNLDITHAYAAVGTYNATVTATDQNGKTATASLTVTVTNPGEGGLGSGTLKCKTVKLRLNFKKPDKDMVSVKGTIEIPDGFDPEGAEVHVNISGVFGVFVLDAKGKAKTDVNGDKNKKFMIKLKFKKGVLQTGEANFTMVFKNGNFQDMWAEYGAVNETVDQKIGIPVTITTSTHVYTDALVGDYKGRQDRSGKFAGKEGLTIGG